jgi:AcrR family transcriptional regulator
MRRAHVAAKTLYDNFSGKEELFLDAFDVTVAEAEATVADACEPIDEGDWEARIEPA